MKSRMWALLAIFVLILALVPAVSAQDDMACLGLSADDCAILQASDANGANVKSFTANFTFDLTIGGIPASEPSSPTEITIQADGSGTFSMDESKMTADNPLAGLSMAMDINASTAGTGDDQSGTVSFVIADGNFYLKDPESGAWKGAKLADIIEQMGSSGLPISPEALMSGQAAEAADPTAALQQLGISEADAMKLVQTPGFLTQERLADEQVAGMNTYPFAFTIDFVPLITSPDFSAMLTKLSQSSDDPNMAQVGMLGAMLPMLLKEGNIKMTRWIGADDQFVHRLALDVNANVDVSAFAGSADSSAQAMEPIVVKMSLVVDLDKINDTAAAVAPEGAEIVPADELNFSS